MKTVLTRKRRAQWVGKRLLINAKCASIENRIRRAQQKDN